MVIAILSSIVDNSGKEDTNGDSPLIQCDDCTTNPFRSTVALLNQFMLECLEGRDCAPLGLVHGGQDRDESNTETGKDTTDYLKKVMMS